ncbi:heparinase II/III domain-containing protein [Salinicoccus roseus]|uniref:heparinase II/III domain-containing protein n=1 Tax=Salinicoccus roseus TaxID=45670 RepID=UPI0023013554|nr:heparinase II/III family protein [Salinicoccus roseus]
MTNTNNDVTKELSRVKLYLDGKLIVKHNFEPIDVSGGIDWDYKHSHNANTYQTYLHSLGILRDLVKIGRQFNDDMYHLKAKGIIESWYEANGSARKANYAWREHPVASRIENIIFFQRNASEHTKMNEDEFSHLIAIHCEFLSEEKNYKPNNHGLMMDNALLAAARYLKDYRLKKYYIDKTLYRVKFALYRDFSRKGTHLENSPEYHRLALNLYKKIEKSLAANKLSIGREPSQLLKMAEMYKSYIIKPNNEYPLIGDSGTAKDLKVKKKYSDFIDYDAGIGILQTENKTAPEQSTWMSFKCGYHSRTHKHKDDLSISLYMDGNDVLIDSGKYSYNAQDPVREFIISPEAHNTVTVKGEDYNLSEPVSEQFKMKITKNMRRGKHKIISGINKLYDKATLVRHAILSTDDILFLNDKVSGDEEMIFQQIFNINEDAEILRINEQTFEIYLGGETYILKNLNEMSADISSSIKDGYVSREFSKYKNNKRIIFELKQKNGAFFTVIYNKKNAQYINHIVLKDREIDYTFKNKKHNVIY